MGPEFWTLVAVVSLIVTIVGLLVLGLIRFKQLCSQIGSFICGHRKPGGESFRLGVAHFGTTKLHWWKARTLSFQPRYVWSRETLEILDRRSLEDANRPELLIVRCSDGGTIIELSMSASAYQGLSSWLESRPPHERGFVI